MAPLYLAGAHGAAAVQNVTKQLTAAVLSSTSPSVWCVGVQLGFGSLTNDSSQAPEVDAAGLGTAAAVERLHKADRATFSGEGGVGAPGWGAFKPVLLSRDLKSAESLPILQVSLPDPKSLLHLMPGIICADLGKGNPVATLSHPDIPQNMLLYDHSHR